MDWIAEKKIFLQYSKKIGCGLLILLVGICFMLLPESKEPEKPASVLQEEQTNLETSLAEILSLVSGAGKVKVLLTQSEGEQTIYQLDEQIDTNDIRRDTVRITNADRNETGLVRQINPPIYLGAIILCQGADNANIRLALMEAVMSATGLTSDRITILKMK